MLPIETIPIDDLNLRLKTKAQDLKIPFEVTLELTYACNLRCVHCYNPTHLAKPEEMNTSEFKSVIRQLVDSGCMLILFSGGEPLARPDAFELMNEAKASGLQVVLNTNATLLDEKKIAQLTELVPTLLSISVYGMTAETYESVTQIRGSFEKFQRGLALLENYPHPVLFKMPVMRQNIHELEFARGWFKDKKRRFIHTVEIHPRVDGDLSPLDARLSPDQAAELRFQYDEVTRCGGYGRSHNGKVSDNTQQLFDCQCGKNSFALTPYGEMNLCVSTAYPKYSLKTGSVKEGWNLLVNFVGNFTPSDRHECPTCDLVSVCSQGSMDAWLNARDFNVCVPYFKETAQLIKARREFSREL